VTERQAKMLIFFKIILVSLVLLVSEKTLSFQCGGCTKSYFPMFKRIAGRSVPGRGALSGQSHRRVGSITENSAMLNKRPQMCARSPWLPTEKLKRQCTSGFAVIHHRCHLIGTNAQDAVSMVKISAVNL
jgi:hypothetical protein